MHACMIVCVCVCNVVFWQIGMGGSYHSWSPMFPDSCGLLLNICDIKLENKPSDRIATDNADNTRIILHTCKLQNLHGVK